jgi:release factor glutamine methyltransferase
MNTSVNELKARWVVQHGIAPEDFLVLALHILGMDRTRFLREQDHILNETQYRELEGLLQRRAQKEPVAYLTGQKEFFGRAFLVTPATLIPRPDSECLIEDILAVYSKTQKKPDFLFDIGTGSGALAITLRKELSDTNLQVLASDISGAALDVAKRNAEAHEAPVIFLEGSLLEPYHSFLTPNISIFIIANLPYVSETLLRQTEPDVHKYEPINALLSEEEGLAHYTKLLAEMKDLLPPSLSVTCWLEISPEQSAPLTEKIKNILPAATTSIGQDLTQRDRFIRFSL